jgi:hypothetical protein
MPDLPWHTVEPDHLDAGTRGLSHTARAATPFTATPLASFPQSRQLLGTQDQRAEWSADILGTSCTDDRILRRRG